MSNKRKIFVYIIFACSAIYGVWFHFISDDDSKKSIKPSNTQTVVENNIEVAEAKIKYETPREAKLIDLSSEPNSIPEGWGRNPFRSHEPTLAAAKKSTESKYTGVPRLTGISYHKNRASFAIINNKVVQANEKINGWHVVSIYRDYVLIKKTGTIEKLTMGELF